jgi:uncharacterized protein
MPLEFETARVSVPAAPQRADIACFVGYVKRSAAPLPGAVNDDLRAAGWVDGPWRLARQRIDSLEHLPVTVESWESFDQLFDWRARPVTAAGAGGVGPTCATYLGAAVRRFFAQGGRRAIVIRAGDPWPFMEDAGIRAMNRSARIAQLVPQFVRGARPFESTNPLTWRGIQHFYGLGDASMLCIPDLPDACAEDPEAPDATLPLIPRTEGFLECSEAEAGPPPDIALRLLAAPRCDSGLGDWTRAIASARDFLYRHRRDTILVAALPLVSAPPAQRDPIEYLQIRGVLLAEGTDAEGTDAGSVSSAFVQLAYPWLATRSAEDLPQLLEPPDGLVAGLIAAGALARGTFRSVAGSLLPAVTDTEPVASWGLGSKGPWARLAQRVCLVARQPDGWALQSDVTTSPIAAWRAGSVSRMVASLVRVARATGEAEMFGANGPELWTRVRRHLEALLTSYWLEGGLGGTSPDEAFEVRCDRGTMTQADLDAGRLVAKIIVLPAAAVEHITVVLALSAAGLVEGGVREVA